MELTSTPVPTDDVAMAAMTLLARAGAPRADAEPRDAHDERDAAKSLLWMCLPAPAAPPARKLAQLPGATASWPFVEGKGCFIKSREGRDLPFLERLYLLLSLPNLILPGQGGRRLGEAIRWKSAAALAAFGLPEGTPAFEIGDVALLEAAIYPQYASGARTFWRPPPKPPNAHLFRVPRRGRVPTAPDPRRLVRHARSLFLTRVCPVRTRLLQQDGE